MLNVLKFVSPIMQTNLLNNFAPANLLLIKASIELEVTLSPPIKFLKIFKNVVFPLAPLPIKQIILWIKYKGTMENAKIS